MDATVVLVTLLTLAADMPAPAPAPTPSTASSPIAGSAETLREIGRVRATTPFCHGLIENAIRAVAIETENGRRLGALEDSLRVVDLDKSQIAKARGTHDLTKRYVDLRAAAVEGDGLMKQFRKDAKMAPDDEQRASLVAFADSVDGALHRQKTLADDVGRLVAYLDTHDPIDKDAHDALVFNAILLESDARFPHTRFDPRDFGPFATVPDSLSTTVKNAADELVNRAAPIAGDEENAAARIDAAFAHC